MTIQRAARLYGRSEKTIKRWKAQGYPIEQPDVMHSIISQLRSRRGVSKIAPKLSIAVPVSEPERDPEGDIIGIHFKLAALRWSLRDSDPDIATRLTPILDITRQYIDELAN
jgi:hypothetical protein